MAFKFVAVLAFVTVASAGNIQPQQQQFYQAAPAEHTVVLPSPPHHQGLEKQKIEEYDHHPQYKFAYNVDDSVTGDSKSHSETRNGDAVEGEYSLIDADGYKRIVHYTADSEHGFNAVVTRVPLNGGHEAYHQDVAVKNSQVTYSAPTVVKTVQPVTYGSSPSSYYKSAPVHYTAQAPAVQVAPASYGSPSYYKPGPISYAAAPTEYKSGPVAQIHSTPYVQAQASNSAPSAFVVKSPSHSSEYHH